MKISDCLIVSLNGGPAVESDGQPWARMVNTREIDKPVLYAVLTRVERGDITAFQAMETLFKGVGG